MLTESQHQALAVYVDTQPALEAHLVAGDVYLVTQALNEPTAAFWVWRSDLSEAEATGGVSPDGTTFSWTALIARSAGEQFGWERLFALTGSVNPSLQNVRQAFADVFSGASNNAPAQRTHMQAMCRRLATVAEQVLATGTGSTASPATMGHEGAVGDNDVVRVAKILGYR